ncbi:hypothetical protein ACVWZP_000552 [Pseudomonas sp. TE36184]
MYWLTDRHRGQAPSHILISMDQIELVLLWLLLLLLLLLLGAAL